MKKLSLAAALLTGLFMSATVIAKTLYVYNWSDYVAPETISRFEKETGIKVVYDVYDSNEILEAKLYAGNTGYDIVFPTNFPYFARQVKAGVFQPLDPKKIPNLKGVDPTFETPLEVDGKTYGAPYLWGTVGYAYNTAKIKEATGSDAPLDSWAMVFEPENLKKFSGCKVAFVDSATLIYPIMLKYLGIDPNTQNPEDYQKVTDKLKSLRPYITYFHGSQYLNDLASGNICVAVGWSGDMIIARERAKAAKNNVFIQYVNPKEGSIFVYDVMAILKDAKNVDEAHQFINYLLDPKIMAELTNHLGYPNPVPASQANIEPAVAKDPAIYPTSETMKGFFTIKGIPLPLEKQMNRDWAKMKARQ